MSELLDKLPKSKCRLFIGDVLWRSAEIHDIKNKYFFPVKTTRGNTIAIEFERKDSTNDFYFFGFAYAAE
jgi:hypothetical protein